MSNVTISTSGFWCGDCLSLLERAFKGVPGVDSISETAGSRVEIRFDDTALKREQVLDTLRRAGFGSEVGE